MKYFIIILFPLLFACEKKAEKADAYGNFETDELLVSAEAQGKLLNFLPNQGQWLEENALVGIIDTTQLYLKKQQILAAISAVRSKRKDLSSQEKVYLEQKQNFRKGKRTTRKTLR